MSDEHQPLTGNAPLTSNNPDFEARVKSSLDASASQIDYQTQHRLQSIRKLALTHLPLNGRNQSVWHMLGNRLIAHWQPSLAGFVLCSLALLLFFSPMRQHFMSPGKLSAQQAMMVDLLDDPDDLEVVGDPGFYVWVNELGHDTSSEKSNAHAS